MKASGFNKISAYGHTKELILSGQVDPMNGGSALFTFGYDLDKEGQREAADSIYRQTIELLEELSSKEDSGMRMLHLASLAFVHGKNLFSLGRFHLARTSFTRSMEIVDSLMTLDANTPLVEQLGATLNWLALSQRKTSMWHDASKSYERAVSLWRHLLVLTQSPERRRRYANSLATALFGAAKVLKKLSQHKRAEEYLRESEEILGRALPAEKIRYHC